jgi:hypothetical protein
VSDTEGLGMYLRAASTNGNATVIVTNVLAEGNSTGDWDADATASGGGSTTVIIKRVGE